MELARTFFTITFILIFTIAGYGQSEDEGRKGNILVESGVEGTVGQLNFGNGFTNGALLLNVGKFISDKFAIKLKGSLVGGSGFSQTSLSLGGKYYFDHKFPVEISAGFSNDSFNDTLFTGNAKMGYAIPLASNINLEPSLGLLLLDSQTSWSFSFTFAMFL